MTSPQMEEQQGEGQVAAFEVATTHHKTKHGKTPLRLVRPPGSPACEPSFCQILSEPRTQTDHLKLAMVHQE